MKLNKYHYTELQGLGCSLQFPIP